MSKKKKPGPEPKFPGHRTAVDGSEAVVAMETAASEGAGAYPITPSTQMGEGWAAAMAAGKPNVHGRRRPHQHLRSTPDRRRTRG